MRKNIANVLWGLILIAFGLLLGARELGLVSFSIFFPGWWTLFLILPCALGIIGHGFGVVRISGLLLGVMLLLQQNGQVELELIEKAFLPTVFFLIGISILIKSVFSGDARKYTGEKRYSAIFAGNKVVIPSGEGFDGCAASAVFGGMTVDLSAADIPDGAVINASSIFGGVDIIVPGHVRVKVSRTAIFGGVDQKAGKRGEEPVLYVSALCVFGGMTIK